MHSQGLQREPAGEPRHMKYASQPTKQAGCTESVHLFKGEGSGWGRPVSLHLEGPVKVG